MSVSGQTDEVARGVHVNVKVHVTGGAMDVLWNAALPFFAALDSGGPAVSGTEHGSRDMAQRKMSSARLLG